MSASLGWEIFCVCLSDQSAHASSQTPDMKRQGKPCRTCGSINVWALESVFQYLACLADGAGGCLFRGACAKQIHMT